MNKKLVLTLVLVIVGFILYIFLRTGTPSTTNLTIQDGLTNTKSETGKNVTLVQPSHIFNIYLDSGFLLDVRDTLKYGESKGFFNKNGLKIAYLGYKNDLNKTNSSPDTNGLNLHVSIFGTMLDENTKKDPISWVGTAGKGIIGYGVSTLSPNNINKIKSVGLTGSGNDIIFLGNLYLAQFGLPSDGIKFIEATYDTDKYKALDSKLIDLTFIKGNRENNSRKYTTLNPLTNKNYYPYRTFYVKGLKDEEKQYIDKFLETYNEIKKYIVDNPEEFKKYVDMSGNSALIAGKDGYYKDLVDSIKDTDTYPNIAQLSDAVSVYQKTKNVSSTDLESLIYKK